MEPLETPGGGGSLAAPAMTESYQAPQTESAAAQPCDSLENDGSGTSNISNSKNPAGSAAMEDPADWAFAMARIRKLWPGFSDELESCIKRIRTCVRTSGKYIGSQDVYYQLSDGTWLRSVAQLKKFLQQPATMTAAAAAAVPAAAVPAAAAPAAATAAPAAAATASAAVDANAVGLVMPPPHSDAFTADDRLPSNGPTAEAATQASPAMGAVLVTPDPAGATIVNVLPSSAAATTSPTAVLNSNNRTRGKLHAVTRDDPEQWQEMVSYICRGWPSVTAADLGLIEAGKCLIRQSGISEGRREWKYQVVGSDEWIRSVPKLRATICLGTTMGNATAASDETTLLAAVAATGHFAAVDESATAGDDVGPLGPVGAPAGCQPGATVQFHSLRGSVGELRWKVPAQHKGPRAALMPSEDAPYAHMQQHALTRAAAGCAEQRPGDAPALAAPHTLQPQQPAQDELRGMERVHEIEAAHAVGSEQQQQQQLADDRHDHEQGLQLGATSAGTSQQQQQHHQQQVRSHAQFLDSRVYESPLPPAAAAISAAAMVQAAPPAAAVSQTKVAAANSTTAQRQAPMPPSPAMATSANDGLLTGPQAPLALISNDAAGVDAAHAVCMTSRMQAASAELEVARARDDAAASPSHDRLAHSPHLQYQSGAQAGVESTLGASTVLQLPPMLSGARLRRQQQPQHEDASSSGFDQPMHPCCMSDNEPSGMLVQRVKHALQQPLLPQPPLPLPPPRLPPPPQQWPPLPRQAALLARSLPSPPLPPQQQQEGVARLLEPEVNKAQQRSAEGNRLLQTPTRWQPQQQQQHVLHVGQRQEQQLHDNAPTPEPVGHVLQSDNTKGDMLLQMLKQSLQPPRHQQQRAEGDIQQPMPSSRVVSPSRLRTFEERQQGQQQLQPPASMHKQQKVVNANSRPSHQPQQDATQQARQPASYEERLHLKQLEKRGIVAITSSNGQAGGGVRDSDRQRHKSKAAANTRALDMYLARRSDKRENKQAPRDSDNRRRLRKETDDRGRHGSRGSSKDMSRTTPSSQEKGTRMLSRNDRGMMKSSSTDRKRSRPLSKDSGPNNHNSESGGQTMVSDKGDMIAPHHAVAAVSSVDVVGMGSPSDVHKKQRMMTDKKSSSAAKAGNDFAALTLEQELVYLLTEQQRLLSCEQSAKQHSTQLQQQVKALQQQVMQSEQRCQQQAQRLLEQQQKVQQQHIENGVLMEHLGQLQHMQGLLELLAQPELEKQCP